MRSEATCVERSGSERPRNHGWRASWAADSSAAAAENITGTASATYTTSAPTARSNPPGERRGVASGCRHAAERLGRGPSASAANACTAAVLPQARRRSRARSMTTRLHQGVGLAGSRLFLARAAQSVQHTAPNL